MRSNNSNRGSSVRSFTLRALLLGAGLAGCAPSAGGHEEAPQAAAAPASAVRAGAGGVDAQREVQAARTLASLPQVVTAENVQRLGFHSADEARQAVSDPPVAVYMVRLDQLRTFRPEQDPGELLVDLETAFYPVRAHGEIHSAMELHKRDGAWEARSFGNTAHAQILDRERHRAAAAHGVAEGSFFEVRVLALNSYFLGHRGKEGLVLTPMLDDEPLGLKAGQSRPAVEIFKLLQPRAQQHNGQPG